MFSSKHLILAPALWVVGQAILIAALGRRSLGHLFSDVTQLALGLICILACITAFRREGRFVSTTSEELNAWLGRESGKPVHVATDNTDVTAELKRRLSFVRSEKEPKKAKGR